MFNAEEAHVDPSALIIVRTLADVEAMVPLVSNIYGSYFLRHSLHVKAGVYLQEPQGQHSRTVVVFVPEMETIHGFMAPFCLEALTYAAPPKRGEPFYAGACTILSSVGCCACRGTLHKCTARGTSCLLCCFDVCVEAFASRCGSAETRRRNFSTAVITSPRRDGCNFVILRLFFLKFFRFCFLWSRYPFSFWSDVLLPR